MSEIFCWFCGLFSSHWFLLASLVATGNSVSAGQLLCGGLFSTDSLSNWCAAVALAHALQENATLKEQLLRVQLATSIGNPPVSLLQQCTNILSQVRLPPPCCGVHPRCPGEKLLLGRGTAGGHECELSEKEDSLVCKPF